MASFLLVLAASPAGAISHRTLLTFTGNSPGDDAGVCVSAVGDVNGDGYADFIVGAQDANAGAGAVYIFYGGPSPHAVPDITLTGEGAGQHFGDSVACAGDVNGDGFVDVIVGAPNYLSDAGRAYIFYGGPTLVSKGAGSADVLLTAQYSGDGFGACVASAGDVNGDGRADVIVGAFGYNASTGRAYIFYGGPTLVSEGAGWADVILTGEAANDSFGMSLASAGDVNGDGRADVIVGAANHGSSTGRAYIFYGGSTLTSKGAANADVILTGEATVNWFGTSVASAGDVNGDGRADVIVGATGYNGYEGRAYIFYGGGTLISKGAGNANVILTGEAANSEFGTSVSTAGDVNGDGSADVIVGAIAYGSLSGRAYVFLGGSLASSSAANADIILGAENQGDYYGASVAGAGDVNGDGYADVIVGAPGYASLTGRTYVVAIYPYQVISPNGGEQWVAGQAADVRWLGQDPANVSLSLDGGLSWSTLLTAVGGQADNTVSLTVPGQTTTTALVRVSYTGQTANRSTSDRSDQVFSIVPPGTPAAAARVQRVFNGTTANDFLGTSASAAADVNGDGYPDLLVGAPGVNSYAGAAYIYFGGPGAKTTPDVTLSGQGTSQFGTAVAAVGDVNGDGYPDILVGAPYYNTNTGRAYVFYGGPTLVSKPAASADVILTGGGTNTSFGISVASAGDVNGDGRPDVIVGATAYTSNTGRAYIFLGGPTLTSKGAGSADEILTGEGTGNNFGNSVASAGDVNGDGRSDVMVAADGYGSNSGRAYLFLGSPTLTSRGAASADVILTGEGASNQFGYSLASAGDINGDGHGDVIVGAPGYSGNAGRAYVFCGGASLVSKPALLADVVLSGEGASNNFGCSVSSAGDVNGDGRADVIVGAYGYGTSAGRAYLFYGGPTLISKPAIAADLIWTGEAANNRFGYTVCSAGDTKRDGFADMAVTAQAYSSNKGRVYLYDMNRYQILSPNGGESWNVGATQTVSWLGAAPADLWLSVDGGGTYVSLGHALGGAATNSFIQRVPHLPSRFARIKLTPSSSQLSGSAQSDSLFSILSSVSLLTFDIQPNAEGGTVLTWDTSPGIGPQGISGYRLYRTDPGAIEIRLGPELITATSYADRAGRPGSNYRLTAVNGLGEETELGYVSTAAIQALSAWPLPYHGGDLHVAFTTAGAGASAERAEIGLFDSSGRLVVSLAGGAFTPGRHGLIWNGLDAQGRRVGQGIYFLRASCGGQISHIKLAVLR